MAVSSQTMMMMLIPGPSPGKEWREGKEVTVETSVGETEQKSAVEAGSEENQRWGSRQPERRKSQRKKKQGEVKL